MPAVNSVMTPAVVIRPIPPPSLGEPEVAVGPGRDQRGVRAGVMPVKNSVTTPAGVIRPIELRAR